MKFNCFFLSLLLLFSVNESVFAQQQVRLSSIDDRLVLTDVVFKIVDFTFNKFELGKLPFEKSEIPILCSIGDTVSGSFGNSYIRITFTKSNEDMKKVLRKYYDSFNPSSDMATGPYILHFEISEKLSKSKCQNVNFDAGCYFENGNLKDSAFYYIMNLSSETLVEKKKKRKREMGWDNNSNTADYVGAIGNLFKKREAYTEVKSENIKTSNVNITGNVLAGNFSVEIKNALEKKQSKEVYLEAISQIQQRKLIADMYASVDTPPQDTTITDVETFLNAITLNKNNIENLLKNYNWENGNESGYSNYFSDTVGFNPSLLKYKGNLTNGIAIIKDKPSDGNEVTICGRFVNCRLTGYGYISKNNRVMFGDVNKTLEGNFVDNKLFGKGSATRSERLNDKNNSGYFIQGKFIANTGFGGFDENGNFYLIANNGSCRIYPEITIINKQVLGVFNYSDVLYGVNESLGNSIFGDEATSSITWSGDCKNGLADGTGILKIKGTTKGFINQNKGYEEEILFGTLSNGHYDNCRVYNFNDFAAMLGTGQKAKKWSVYKQGKYIDEDLSEVEKVWEIHNASIKQYQAEQKQRSVNYSLATTGSNDATVFVSNVDWVDASISVEDGGVMSSNVNANNYSSKVFDNKGNLIKSYSNPFDDNGLSQPKLTQYQLPGKIIVNYSSAGGKQKMVECMIKKGGNYVIKIY